MSTLSELKIVLVGCGAMANGWIDITQKLDDSQVKLVGLVDINRAAAEAKADKFKLPRTLVHDSLKQAIQATGANVVFDVTIPQAHAEVTQEALALGCHVLGEKPMSTNLADAKKMVAAAQAAGRLYGVAQTRRPGTNIESLVDFLRGGAIGDVAEVHSDFYLGPHFGGFREEMDNVLLVDMAIHTFDNARQIGQCDPVAVFCQAWNPPHSWFKGNASAAAVFEMKSKTGQPMSYIYRGSWCAQGFSTSWNGDWRIIGSKGTARWDGEDGLKAQIVDPDVNQGFIRPTKELRFPWTHRMYAGHEAIIRNFIDAVKNGTPLMCPCEDNIKSLAMVMAAVESAQTRQRVEIKW